MISEKKYPKVHVSSLWYMQAPKITLSCKLVVFIDMSMFIITEAGRNFKTFLKENYAIWTVVT